MANFGNSKVFEAPTSVDITPLLSEMGFDGDMNGRAKNLWCNSTLATGSIQKRTKSRASERTGFRPCQLNQTTIEVDPRGGHRKKPRHGVGGGPRILNEVFGSKFFLRI